MRRASLGAVFMTLALAIFVVSKASLETLIAGVLIGGVSLDAIKRRRT